MSNLSTALRPKMLIRVDTYGKLVEGVKNIYLTQEEANFISKAWASSVYAHWTDKNTGDVKMILNRNDWRMEDTQVQAASKVMKWLCDCGRSNHMHIWPPENCACKGDRTPYLQELQSKLLLNQNK